MGQDKQPDNHSVISSKEVFIDKKRKAEQSTSFSSHAYSNDNLDKKLFLMFVTVPSWPLPKLKLLIGLLSSLTEATN